MSYDFREINEADVREWSKGAISSHAVTWLTQILNGDYDLQAAREDCWSIKDAMNNTTETPVP